MAQLTITIPDNKLQAVLDAFALRFGYMTIVANPAFNPNEPESPTNSRAIDNPENKAQFAKRMLINQIKKIYNNAKMKELDISIKNDLNDLS